MSLNWYQDDPEDNCHMADMPGICDIAISVVLSPSEGGVVYEGWRIMMWREGPSDDGRWIPDNSLFFTPYASADEAKRAVEAALEGTK